MKELIVVLMIFGLILVAAMLMECSEVDKEQIIQLRNQLKNLTDEEAVLEKSYQRLNVSYYKLLKQYDDLLNEYYEYKQKETIPLKASYEEVMDFIRRDKTDQLEYDAYTFDCSDFTATLLKNALKERIFGCPVQLEYPDSGHVIAAFPTHDRGMIYIEPQDDQEVFLRKGYSYYHLNYDYEFYIGYDDTIVRWVEYCDLS